MQEFIHKNFASAICIIHVYYVFVDMMRMGGEPLQLPYGRSFLCSLDL